MIVKQKTQWRGGTEESVIQCYCGEESYIKVSTGEDGDYYLTVSQSPTTWAERLKLAWDALRGLEFHHSNHVMMSPAQMAEFRRDLSKLKPRTQQ